MPAFVEGSVSPGYEPVKELFEANVKSGLEDNAQLCIYVDGVRIRGMSACKLRLRNISHLNVFQNYSMISAWL